MSGQRGQLGRRTAVWVIRNEQWQSPGRSILSKGNGKSEGSEAGSRKYYHLELGSVM